MSRKDEESEFTKNWDTDPGPITQAVHEAFDHHPDLAPAVNGSADFPTETPEQAAASKERAAQELEAGRISADEKAAIDAKADATLGKAA